MTYRGANSGLPRTTDNGPLTIHYLIDGYNLMHAMGVMLPRMGPHGLEHARLRLLGLLAASYKEAAGQVTVIFDAAHAPPGATATEEHHGVHVRFAVAEKEADELIELLIRQESAPKQLAVVSDDHRIQRAARRRHCQVLACDAYLDALDRERRRHLPQPPANEPAKPKELSSREEEHWLREFAELENDPAMKEVFGEPNFDDDRPSHSP